MNALVFNVPLTLTIARLILSPLVLPFLFVQFLPLQSLACNSMLAFFFVILSLTDFFDGYLARKYRQTTALGSLLDPLADKFLLYSTLIPLVYIHRIYFYWAVLFIGREFFIMGLREVALFYGFSLSVSSKAKLKTAFQMSYLTWTIINPHYMASSYAVGNAMEVLLLVCALFFSLYSAIEYYLSFIKQIKEPS